MYLYKWSFGNLWFSKVVNFHRRLSIGRMESRGILRISGKDASAFLQGLVTNDMRSISSPNSFMYSLFLNAKGRVLTDAFIYHCINESNDKSEYLIEVDKLYQAELVTHISTYNLRNKVTIHADDLVHIWLAMPRSFEHRRLANLEAWLPVNIHKQCDKKRLLLCVPDPRAIPGWSGRILVHADYDANDIFVASDTRPLDLVDYCRARWCLGLPEGISEVIPNNTLPMDINADLSGGVSFSKGCYIGQELTARSHFTGVVRRRFVPINLETLDESSFSKKSVDAMCSDMHNAPIYQSNNKETCTNMTNSRPVGWIRGLHPTSSQCWIGIGLIKLSDNPKDVTLVTSCKFGGEEVLLKVNPMIPSWWPAEIYSCIERLPYP